MWRFHRQPKQDVNLSKKIAAAYPTILYKSLCAYLEYSDKVKDIWGGLPAYFINQRNIIAGGNMDAV